MSWQWGRTGFVPSIFLTPNTCTARELKIGTHHKKKPFQVRWVRLYFNTALAGLSFEEVKLKEPYFYVDSDSILSLISSKLSLGS